jgi:hypothetical protein
VFDFLLWQHIPDRALIEYRAGLLDKECSEMLEAHLLLCPTCQLQLVDLIPRFLLSRAIPGLRIVLR